VSSVLESWGVFFIFFIYMICIEILYSWVGLLCRYKNQNVAIKIVHKGDTPEEVAKREGRFMREVAMLSKVQHKNLVKVWFC